MHFPFCSENRAASTITAHVKQTAVAKLTVVIQEMGC